MILLRGLIMGAVLVIATLLCGVSASASDTPHSTGSVVSVQPGQDTGPIGKQVVFLPDTDASFTIDALPDVSSPDWIRNTTTIPGFGFKSHPYWLRFSLQNNTPHDHLWLTVGYPLLNHVDVYVVNGSTMGQHLSGGTRVVDNNTSYQSHQMMFRLSVPSGTQRQVILRVNSESSLIIPLSLSAADTRITRDDLRLRALGMFIGALIALLLYHLVVLTAFYETSFLLYIPVVLFSAACTALLNGILDRYLLPGVDVGGHLFVPFTIASVATFGLWLTRAFLSTAQRSRVLDRIVTISAVAASGIAVLSLILPYRYGIILTAIMIPVSITVAVVASLTSFSQGFRPAIYFAAGWFMIVLGAAAYALRAFGLLPENPLTENMLYIAIALMMLLVALAMASRYSLIRARSEAAQKDWQQQVIATNRALEAEVDARTREVEEQNRQLDDARRALVLRQGKMATGVMSAGLAHEINNPNNFVSVGCQVFESRLQQFEHLMNTTLDEDAPQEVIDSLQRFVMAQRQHLEATASASAALSEIVTRFRTVSTNDEADVQLADLMTRFERMVELVRPGLPDTLALTLAIKDYPMMECRAGQIIQILIITLNLYAGLARQTPVSLTVSCVRHDNGLRIDFVSDHTLTLSQEQGEWLTSLLEGHAATLSRPSAQTLSLWLPLQLRASHP
jgi:two-component system NtrC family sensor kinase